MLSLRTGIYLSQNWSSSPRGQLREGVGSSTAFTTTSGLSLWGHRASFSSKGPSQVLCSSLLLDSCFYLEAWRGKVRSEELSGVTEQWYRIRWNHLDGTSGDFTGFNVKHTLHCTGTVPLELTLLASTWCSLKASPVLSFTTSNWCR